MSVEITFQPANLTGLVAEGILISDAAHRMGVSLPFTCRGLAECKSCRVVILQGAELLSPVTDAEVKALAGGHLTQAQRLACQARLIRSGEIVVNITDSKSAEDDPSASSGMKKTFGKLPLDQKIKTLVQLEALTMYEAMNAVIDKPLAAGEKVFDKIFKTGKTKTP